MPPMGLSLFLLVIAAVAAAAAVGFLPKTLVATLGAGKIPEQAGSPAPGGSQGSVFPCDDCTECQNEPSWETLEWLAAKL